MYIERTAFQIHTPRISGIQTDIVSFKERTIRPVYEPKCPT